MDRIPRHRRPLKTVLFLCTQNFFRSRFAEILFNHQAAAAKLDWTAISRGLSVSDRLLAIGPISGDVRLALSARGIALGSEVRSPRQVEESDFKHASLIIAMNDEQHRIVITRRFAEWKDRVEYWRIPDLGEADSADTLAGIEREVGGLVERLRQGDTQ